MVIISWIIIYSLEENMNVIQREEMITLKFKKIILAAVLILSLFAFVGCSNDPQGEVKGVTDENSMYDDNGTNNDSLKEDLNDVKNDVKDGVEDMMDGNTSDGGVKDNVNDRNANDLPY